MTQACKAQLMGICRGFIDLRSKSCRDLFTVETNWQPECDNSSKKDQFLPRNLNNNGFLGHKMCYWLNFLNNMEAFYLESSKAQF